MLTTDDSLQINDKKPHLNAMSKNVSWRVHGLARVLKFISPKILRVIMRAVKATLGNNCATAKSINFIKGTATGFEPTTT